MPEFVKGERADPFEEGNLVAVKHGAFSDTVISAAAERIRQKLLEQGLSYFADDTFTPAIQRYCRAEARAVLLHRWVMEKADADGVESVKQYLWMEAGRAESNAAKFAQDCGLDPRGRAAVARDLGLAHSIGRQESARNMQALKERGRDLRLQRNKELGNAG